MIGFGDFVWLSRLYKYYEEVIGYNKKTCKRKFVSRCKKVNWEKMDEVENLSWFKLKDYLKNNEDLFVRLYKLEYNRSIYF
jgi:hypothetical protein